MSKHFRVVFIIAIFTLLTVGMVYGIGRIPTHAVMSTSVSTQGVYPQLHAVDSQPSADTLNRVIARLQEVNTSGNLMSGSNYQTYIDNGYITFSDGQWKLTDKGKQIAGGKTGSTGKPVGLGDNKGSTVDIRPQAVNGVIPDNKVCSDTWGGGGHYKNVVKCTGSNLGGMAYIESPLPFKEDDDEYRAKIKALFDSAPSSSVKAAYFNMGTNNDAMKNFSSGNISTTNQSGCLYGSEGGCIKWGDDSTRAAAVAATKRAIEQAKESGANTIRFDQLDVCEDDNGKTYSDECSKGLVNALTEISAAAKAAGLNVVGNNGWVAQQALIDAYNSGKGAKVVAAMLDDKLSNINKTGGVKQQMKDIVKDVPLVIAGY